jgi:hypothetical protein
MEMGFDRHLDFVGFGRLTVASDAMWLYDQHTTRYREEVLSRATKRFSSP